MVDLDPIIAGRRPTELRLFQQLGIKADAGASHQAIFTRPFGPEDVKYATERVIAGVRTCDSKLSGPLRKSLG